jgi:uncharacterized membrane protein YphA (DoxX/SURF4 family)
LIPSSVEEHVATSDIEAKPNKNPEIEAPGEMQEMDSKSVDILRCGIALAFFVTLLLSRKLWLTTRDYPLSPVWNRIPSLSSPWDILLFWSMEATLLGVAFLPNPRGALKVMCGIGFLWAITDQSRWQPYFVLYMALLASLLALPFQNRRAWTNMQIEWALLPPRLILSFAYLYAGLQKFNHQFVTDVFPWLVGPLKQMIHLDVSRLNTRWALAWALCAAGAEMMGGVWLLFPKTRRPAALFLISMHGFILLMIGPFGYQWNTVIWPWNIAMMVGLWALFWRREASAWPTPNLLRRVWWREVGARSPLLVPVVLLFFGLMPMFSFFGWWDSYLSFSLYSGSTCKCEIYVDAEDLWRLPPAAVAATDLNTDSLNPITWSTEEMGAMPYPEPRIYRSLCTYLARRARHGPVLVQISGKPNLLTGERREQYFCFPSGGGPAREISEDEFDAMR